MMENSVYLGKFERRKHNPEKGGGDGKLISVTNEQKRKNIRFL
jgi:hypothetical protein